MRGDRVLDLPCAESFCMDFEIAGGDGLAANEALDVLCGI